MPFAHDFLFIFMNNYSIRDLERGNTMAIKIGIVGYGNLGKGVETELALNPDMELTGVFTRRDPAQVPSNAAVYPLDEITDFKDKIDVLILCGGSKSDIPVQAPILQQNFHTVNSYDNHAEIPAHFDSINETALTNQTVGVIATGWDPGLFSLNRLVAESVLPKGETYTFWGKGVSQGHSDAIRRVAGVKLGVQYTLPNDDLITEIKEGKEVSYTKTSSHKRVCYVVPEEGADKEAITKDIQTMKDYFAEYESEVHFIDEAEFHQQHTGMPHGGRVIRRGYTDEANMAVYEFSLDLDSNPQFTAAAAIAYARAAHRLAQEKQYGAKTVFDIAPAYLSPKSGAELRKELL